MEMLRRAKGLSLQQLGDEIAYSASYLSRMERMSPVEAPRIHRRFRKAVEAFFGVSMANLLAPVDTAPPGEQGAPQGP